MLPCASLQLSVDDDQKLLTFAAKGQTCAILDDASSLAVNREGEVHWRTDAAPLCDVRRFPSTLTLIVLPSFKDFQHLGTEVQVTDTGSPPLTASFFLFFARSEAPTVEGVYDRWHIPIPPARTAFMVSHKNTS